MKEKILFKAMLTVAKTDTAYFVLQPILDQLLDGIISLASVKIITRQGLWIW